MNIYAKEGHVVKGVFVKGKLQNGTDYDKEKANKFIKEGIEYTVESLEVQNFSSTVSFKEFPRETFNTVHFYDVTEISKPDQLKDVDLTSLRATCEQYLNALKTDEHRDNNKHYIFMEVMETFYGKDVWGYINE